jgi:hypothetical protein
VSKSDDDKSSFELSTSQLIKLVNRYHMDKFNFKTLQSMPLADLSPQERNFIMFLRRNRPIFDRIAKLDNDPDTLSVTDLKLAAQLAGDSMVLSSEDLKYLNRNSLTKVDEGSGRSELRGKVDNTTSGQAAQRLTENSAPPTAHDMEALLLRLAQLRANASQTTQTPFSSNSVGTTQPRLRYADLMNFSLRGLTEMEKSLLAYMQSPAVAHMLQKIADSQEGFITVETIQVLMSLISNPMLLGSIPIVFFKRTQKDPKSLLESKQEEELGDAENASGLLSTPSPTIQNKREYHIQAEDILSICHQIKEDGQVSLSELRKYQPKNKREAKLMKLLGKSSIFHRLSSLDHHDETLSDEDIRLAVASKALVLSDSSMVLVVLP